jgi:hypothetical protein
MNLESTYLKWKKEAQLEGQRIYVEQALKFRFGALEDSLSPLVELLL